MGRSAAACCAALLLSAGVPGPLRAASFTPLGDLPGGSFSSHAGGISADGEVVVGRSQTATVTAAFRWEAGVMTELLAGQPGITSGSEAHDASADGSVVAGTITSYMGTGRRAFRWEGGTLLVLPATPGGHLPDRAHALSDDGTVVVGSVQGASVASSEPAFRWTAAGIAELPDVATSAVVAAGVSPDGTQIVGYRVRVNQGALHWVALVPTQLSCAPGLCTASEVTDSGIIGGESDDGGMRWVGGVGTTLPGIRLANGISADGTRIVGWEGAIEENAVLWDESSGADELQTLLENEGVDLTGWDLRSVTGISADGLKVAGWGTNPSGFPEAFLANVAPPAVPALPGAMFLLAPALLLLAAYAARGRYGP